jgi:L-glyceraldehyde 3-phosphate reductase
MTYNRCGRSGIQLPTISLGLWQNFGGVDQYETARATVRADLSPYRDELIISTKAGYDMWLGSIVRSGRALISNYPPDRTAEAAKILRDLGTRCLIHQPRYNMLDRRIEDGLLDVLTKEGIGCIAFSVLNQGLLTDKYLNGIPKDSRAARPDHPLKNRINDAVLSKIRAINQHAQQRGQTLAQMAIAWVLRHEAVTTALMGASHPEQIDDCVAVGNNMAFSDEELETIESILN